MTEVNQDEIREAATEAAKRDFQKECWRNYQAGPKAQPPRLSRPSYR